MNLCLTNEIRYSGSAVEYTNIEAKQFEFQYA